MLTRRPPLKIVVAQMKHTLSAEDIQRPSPEDIIAVVIGPRDKIGDEDRRIISAAPFVQFTVDAERGKGTPESFDRSTLHWALKSADAVIVWGGDLPTLAPKLETSLSLVRSAMTPYVRPGGRVTLVNVREHQWDEWVEYATEQCKPGADVVALLNPPAEV